MRWAGGIGSDMVGYAWRKKAIDVIDVKVDVRIVSGYR